MGKGSAIANIVVGLVPILAGLSLFVFSRLDLLRSGAGVTFALALMLVGFVFFALAKFTQFRSGHWLSLGPHGMSPWARRVYAIGLVAIGIGAVGSVGAVFLSQSW